MDSDRKIKVQKFSQKKRMAYLKSTPMSKEEVHLLLDLVASKPILTSKNTKASVNKLKRRAWAEIEVEFNAKNEKTRPRDQLSLRWVNLKKTCRKKCKNRGKQDPADQDGIMERVLSLLGASNTNFDLTDGCDEMSDSGDYGIEENYTSIVPDNLHNITSAEAKNTNVSSKYMYKTELHKGVSQVSGVKLNRDNEIRERNLAMAEYFEKKAAKLDIEIKLLKLQFLNKKRKFLKDIDI